MRDMEMQQMTNNGRQRTNGLLICTLVLCLALSSCFKEKPLAPPSNQNVGQTATIEMGPSYQDQFFYSLATNSVISHNSHYIYDLMFDCDAYKFNVWLNTSKQMCVLRTDKTDLKTVTINDTVGRDFKYELGEYNVDSNSFGQWWSDSLAPLHLSKGKVYIIYLGVNANGDPQGFVKMKLNDYNNAYSISFAHVNDSAITTSLIFKDESRNYKYYSFDKKNTVETIEPDKALWDLCFTRYTYVFYEPYYLPYAVTGVLHNPARVSAYLDSTVNFDSIKIKDFNFQRLQTRRDAIGYNWKPYEIGGTYTTNQKFTYFIKTDENRFYKLHFIDFLRPVTLENGYPNFEFYRL